MKKILSAILAMTILFTLAACNIPQQTEDPTTEPTTEPVTEPAAPTLQEPEFDPNLEYTVPKITCIRSDYIQDDGEPAPVRKEYEYEDNKLVRISSYWNDVLEYEWTYDGSLDRVLTETRYDEDGTVSYRDVYEYDEQGNRVKGASFDGEEQNYTYTYEYDDNGKLIKEANITEGQQESATTYAYDAQGNLIEKIEYWGSAEDVRYTYVYDAQGNQIEEYKYDDGEEIHRVWSYDEAGNPLTLDESYNGESSGQTVFRYDDEGRLLDKVYCIDGEEYIEDTYTYDEQGRLTYYANAGDDYSFEYDDAGNLCGFYGCYAGGGEDAVIEYEMVTVTGDVAAELDKIIAEILQENRV